MDCPICQTMSHCRIIPASQPKVGISRYVQSITKEMHSITTCPVISHRCYFTPGAHVTSSPWSMVGQEIFSASLGGMLLQPPPPPPPPPPFLGGFFPPPPPPPPSLKMVFPPFENYYDLHGDISHKITPISCK